MVEIAAEFYVALSTALIATDADALFTVSLARRDLCSAEAPTQPSSASLDSGLWSRV